jgi:hypothetical protein
MEIESGTRIWRYMDLARFASLLAARSLYFACPNQFSDPYEGFAPRSHIEAESKMIQGFIDPILELRPQFVAKGIPLQSFDNVVDTFAERVRTAHKEAAAKFGVTCWHESEHESDAMWKLYSASGQAVAIESTVGQLKASLGNRNGLVVERVRYMDFDRDPIEKGHRHYHLFIKRKCFDHEKEVRATILLPQEGKGVLIPCDLDALVTCVHVSPLVEGFVKDAIESVCAGETHRLKKPVHQSSLYSAPTYSLQVQQ